MYSCSMKMICRCLCVSIVLISLAFPSFAQRDDMTIVHSFFEPFIWSEDGTSRGIYVDVLTEAFEKRMGITVSFKNLPWKRAQAGVRQGVYDGFVSLETPERNEYSVACQIPVAEANMGLATYVGHPRLQEMKTIDKIADLKDYQLITYLGHGWAKRYLTDFSIQFSGNDLATVLEMLARHRGDITVEPVEIVNYNIHKLDLKDRILVVPGVQLSTLEFKLLVGKMSRFVDQLPRLESVLLAMKEDGTFDEILNRYK